MAIEKGAPRSEYSAYDDSSLKLLLLHDAWPTLQAISLICDIDLENSFEPLPTTRLQGEWENERPTRCEMYEDPRMLHGIALLSDDTLFCLQPIRNADGSAIEHANSLLRERAIELERELTDQDTDLIGLVIKMENRLIALEKFRAVLAVFLSNLEHSENSRHAPTYFVSWAKSKNIEIPWLEWAIARGYLDGPFQPSTSVQVGLDKREKDTLHALIGAFLKELQIDPNQRGVIKKIVGIAEDYGAPIGKTKVAEVLKYISIAKESVQDRKRR